MFSLLLFYIYSDNLCFFSVPLDTSDIWSDSRPKSVGHTQKLSECPAVPTIFVFTANDHITKHVRIYNIINIKFENLLVCLFVDVVLYCTVFTVSVMYSPLVMFVF